MKQNWNVRHVSHLTIINTITACVIIIMEILASTQSPIALSLYSVVNETCYYQVLLDIFHATESISISFLTIMFPVCEEGQGKQPWPTNRKWLPENWLAPCQPTQQQFCLCRLPQGFTNYLWRFIWQLWFWPPNFQICTEHIPCYVQIILHIYNISTLIIKEQW